MYLGCCVLGYFVAVPLRKRGAALAWLDPAQSILVLVLIFAMGLRVGSNEEAVRNLGTYGLYAFVFTCLVLVLSIASVSVLRRLLGYDRWGLQKWEDGERLTPDKAAPARVDSSAGSGTVKMLALVSAGLALSYWLVKTGRAEPEVLGNATGLFIMVGLCLLLVFIGLDMGLKGNLWSDIRSAGRIAFFIPIAVAVGTFAGSAIAFLILPISLKECFAVGAGFGWYSLSSGIILDAGYVTAGTISFMHNVMRELFSVLFIPVVAKRVGYMECVALPGSAGMDVGLPIITRAAGTRMGICSFVSGFLLSLAVPVIVPLFL